jgi:hypothetical protein
MSGIVSGRAPSISSNIIDQRATIVEIYAPMLA